MKFIRIGNDIPFKWTITRHGKAEMLNPDTCEVQLYDPHNARLQIEYSVADNVVTGIFRGMDQHVLGEYCLVLVENRDKVDMSTVDCVGCWTLVAHTYMQSGKGKCCLSTEPVEIEGEMTVPSNGLSAYDIAVLHGFEGTEEEWLDSLVVKGMMKLMQDSVDPDTWNLLDYKNKVVSSFVIPNVISAVFDNETKLITLKYNTSAGRKDIQISLEDLKATNVGDGLKLDELGDIAINIDKSSHAALSVSKAGLKLDGSHFANSENELLLNLWSDRIYPDY